MELKDFIKDTVTQISDAVIELNGNNTLYPLAVNPVRNSNDTDQNITSIAGKSCSITNIDFDLSLTISGNKGLNAKVGVLASVVGLGVSSSDNTQNENVSKIKFSLPVLLPQKDM